MKTKRILHVIGSLNNGGSQAMIMNLYENIDRSKLQFDFVIDRPNELAYSKRIEELGGKIYIMPQFNIKNLFVFYKEWHRFFLEHKEYEIIHGHVRSTASIYLNIARKFNLYTIAHSHSTSSGKGITAVIKNILQYPIRFSADYFFACSKDAGEWLFGRRIVSLENFKILKNAIDAIDFSYDEQIRNAVRKEFNIENKYVVGHVGRFDTSKNHEFLIEIFEEIHKKEESAVLLLIGNGDLKGKILKLVQTLGLEDCIIFTDVRSDIPDLLKAIDVFVFPSLYEGLGMVAIEAQAAGLPCVVSNAIPNEAIILDDVKRVSIKENASTWADHILNYKTYVRRNTFTQIKSSGYHIAETSNWIENFYLDCLGGKQ